MQRGEHSFLSQLDLLLKKKNHEFRFRSALREHSSESKYPPRQCENVPSISRHFLLCLQSAAFAPLLVTFCAISAKFDSQLHGIADLALVCSKGLGKLLQLPTVSRRFFGGSPSTYSLGGKSMPLYLDSCLAPLGVTPPTPLVEFTSAIETVEGDADPSPPSGAVVSTPPSSTPVA